MPNISVMANKAKNFINAFAIQARRSGQYSSTALRSRMVAKALTAGATTAKGSLSGMSGILKSGMTGIRREAMDTGRSLAFHMPSIIGAGVGAAYGGYNDVTGRRGPGLISGALMGGAAGYGFRASTMASVRGLGRDIATNASMARMAFNRGYLGSVRNSLSDVRAGARAGRKWAAI